MQTQHHLVLMCDISPYAGSCHCLSLPRAASVSFPSYISTLKHTPIDGDGWKPCTLLLGESKAIRRSALHIHGTWRVSVSSSRRLQLVSVAVWLTAPVGSVLTAATIYVRPYMCFGVACCLARMWRHSALHLSGIAQKDPHGSTIGHALFRGDAVSSPTPVFLGVCLLFFLGCFLCQQMSTYVNKMFALMCFVLFVLSRNCLDHCFPRNSW